MRTTLAIIALTLIISLPSLPRIPRVLPFLAADVRAAAPLMLEDLRKQGLWLVNVDIVRVAKEPNVCFTWEETYRSRERVFDPKLLTTCAP